MATRKVIRLTEQDLREMVMDTVRKLVRESRYDDLYDYADYEDEELLTGKQDFENSDFEYELRKRFPNKDLECWCDNDGTITVTDNDTGQEYTVYGEAKYETQSLGYPSSRNPYSEAEGLVGYYDFSEALEDVIAKIEADERYNS